MTDDENQPVKNLSPSGRFILHIMHDYREQGRPWVTKRDLVTVAYADVPKRTLTKTLPQLVQAGLVESHASTHELHPGHNPTLYRLTC